ncbi:uncharacterized protein LOC126572274 isoform X2 [Anopheles aquasalis]|uniref:uncharacterized protein LOC126572274 isoform X2 n=1 Tax=Anopheles aquasalis TaxID=42839 RepID=UPI00215AC22B|nr:uncharacterized protein LOC126572274 isoform X2 [Anopheles aquasalis]
MNFPPGTYQFEADLVNKFKAKNRISLEKYGSIAKTQLQQNVGRNGDNLFCLLARLITKLLDEASTVGVVDLFEEYCRQVKADFFSPCQPRLRPGAIEEAANAKRILMARQTLEALDQMESEKTAWRPPGNQLFVRELNAMGFGLPRGMDYFICAEMDRRVHTDPHVKLCQFWGIVRALRCDYYILELEHHDQGASSSSQWPASTSARNSEIVSGIISSLLGQGSVTPEEAWSSADELAMVETEASLKEITLPVVLDILNDLNLTESSLELTRYRKDVDVLLTEVINRLSCISIETLESQLETPSMVEETREREALPVKSTESLLRARLERLQLEARLNKNTFLVSENPRSKPWHVLPNVTIDQIQQSESTPRLLVGPDLQAPVSQGSFAGLEENWLRARIAKISTYRDGNIDGSATNLSLAKCLSGLYGSTTEFDQELVGELAERWYERKEFGMQYWMSVKWPGLCAFNAESQFHCRYFGCGLEKQREWFTPNPPVV